MTMMSAMEMLDFYTRRAANCRIQCRARKFLGVFSGEIFMAAPAKKPAAAPKPAAGKKDAEKKPLFPSDFGSHASMTDAEATGKIAESKQDAGDPWVILKDERGHYATRKSRLDTGLADPARCATLEEREKSVKQLASA
jgi:hypothetical protein